MNTENIKEFFRNRSTIGVIISIALIALISLIYFYPDAIQGNELRQYDTMQGAAIGHEAEAYREATGESPRWTNSLFGGMPTFQIAPSYPSNRLFEWVNTAMGLGLPSPSNLIAMMMIGFFILLISMKMRWYVALIGAVAYGFSSYFIIIIGAGHIWKFVTLAYVPPTIAGVILAYRGKYLVGGSMAAFFAMMQIASNHVQMTYYFLFVILGIVIAYLIISVQQRKIAQWGIATGILVIAGAFAVCSNLPSLYNTYEYSKETMRGGHSRLTSDDQGDNDGQGGLNKEYITQYSYGTSETFTLLIPNVKGGASMKPEKGSLKTLSLADRDETKEMVRTGKISPSEAQYLQYINQYFGEPEGTNGPVYVGALIVALFLVGCGVIKGPFKWVLVILTILSVLLALGRNCMWLTEFMIDYMPMYNKFRTPESILVIAEFTMPLLGVMALNKLLTEKDALKHYKKSLYWGFGIVLGLCLLGVIIPGIYGTLISSSDRQIDAIISRTLQSQGADASALNTFSLNNPRIYDAIESVRKGMIRADALRSFLIVFASVGLILLYFKKKLGIVLTAGALGLVIAIDLIGVNKRYLDSASFVEKKLTTGEPFPLSDSDLQILADTAMNYRVMNIPQFMRPDPSYHHKAIGGYHAAKLTSYQDLIDRHLIHFLEGNPDESDWNVLDMLNARYVVDPSGKVFINDGALGNAWFVDSIIYVRGANEEMAALDMINPAKEAAADIEFQTILGKGNYKNEGDTIYETSYAPNRLTYHVDSKEGGTVVFSEIYFPWGWKAWVDGNKVDIARVNYVLRAINVPAGSHTIEMLFDPDSLKATTTIAYISIILIYISLAIAIVFTGIKISEGKTFKRD